MLTEVNKQEVSINIMQTNISELRRPKLLIRAARAGIHEYRRCRDLKGVTGVSHTSSGTQLIDLLFEEELRLDEERTERSAAYNVRNHIRVLTALLVETSNHHPQNMAA